MYFLNNKIKVTVIFITIILMLITGCSNQNNRVISNINEENSDNSTVDNENSETVIIDNVEYVGYKGPVQGEIKYEEGRPADENSVSLKASGDIGSPYHIYLIVTQNYGHTKMFGKNVGLVKDEVGMEVMFRNLDIQTAYGGGFVNAINGLESKFTFFTGAERKKEDWFYWVNGILAPIGIAEYRPQQDDVIWWDYHDWNMTMFIPAVIGSYPQPFKNGFWGKNPGTVIMYLDKYKEDAEKLKENLINLGVENIDVIEYSPSLLENQKKYSILIGEWEEISKDNKLLTKVNKKNKFYGVYVEFEDDKLNALDFNGKVVNSYSSDTGAIYAYSSGMGSTKPLWIVTGIDETGVENALDVLINKPETIDLYFGAVVEEDKVINVPFLN